MATFKSSLWNRIISIWCGLLLGYSISFVAGLILAIICIMIYVLVAKIMAQNIQKREVSLFEAYFIVGYFLRIALAIIVAILPYFSADVLRAINKIPHTHYAILFFGNEYGLYEGIVRKQNEKILREIKINDKSKGIDAYSGIQYKSDALGFSYSIGPDCIDDKGVINFDPTNGMFSRGDITATCYP